MKPLNENPFYIPTPAEAIQARKEITEFINHECQYAELPLFNGVVLNTSMERYKKACRQLRVTDDVEIRTSKGRIIVCKKNYKTDKGADE